MNRLIRFKNTETFLLVAALFAAVLPSIFANANPMTGAGYFIGGYFSQLNGYQNSQDPALRMTMDGSNFFDLMNYSRMVQSAQANQMGVDFPVEFYMGQDIVPITPQERVSAMIKAESQSGKYLFSNSVNASDSSIGIISEGEKHSSINESFSKIYTFEDFMKEPVSADLERAIRETPPLPATRRWDLERIGFYESGSQAVR